MILDELMPTYDVSERHELRVRATADVVYRAARDADLTAGLVPRLLMTLRGMTRLDRVIRMADLERMGFTVVAEDPPHEVVIGLMGKFWTPGGNLCARVTREDFASGPPPGFALAGWNFSVEPVGPDESVVRTETRVRCSPGARTRFRLYWLLVRSGSGLIRRSMLRAIRARAEGAPQLNCRPDG